MARLIRLVHSVVVLLYVLQNGTSGPYSAGTRFRALTFSSEQWLTIPWAVLRWIALPMQPLRLTRGPAQQLKPAPVTPRRLRLQTQVDVSS